MKGNAYDLEQVRSEYMGILNTTKIGLLVKIISNIKVNLDTTGCPWKGFR